ncbi:MAG: M23 family metallopeptidase [Roseivirga sp.]|nr:M23 family metallopeptidase [Roseivirga sp.]
MKIYAEQTKTAVIIYADNDKLYPQSTELTLDLKGLKPRQKPDKYIVVPPGSKRYQLTELVIPQNRSWSYNYSFTYYMGDVTSEHNDSYAYRLPFEEGKRFKVAQGYNGKSSHQGENALDFNLPADEVIMAARPGTVVRLKEDSNRGCPSKSCAKLGNFVTIMHEDGSFADYYHLKQNGVLVELGTNVKAGEPLGLTGNTGWATGYHLHFIVYAPRPKGRETLPTQFRTAEGTQRLEEEESYTSVN